MKRLRFLLVMGVVFLLGGHSLFAKESSKEQNSKEFIKELVESGNYTIEVDKALPAAGRTLHLTSNYRIEINGDSIVSYLPYFGRAYSIPYGGGDGLRFKQTIQDYSLTYDKKGVARIKFKASTPEDQFTFNIQVFDNGVASISVTPVNRQHITFTGDLKLKD